VHPQLGHEVVARLLPLDEEEDLALLRPLPQQLQRPQQPRVLNHRVTSLIRNRSSRVF